MYHLYAYYEYDHGDEYGHGVMTLVWLCAGYDYYIFLPRTVYILACGVFFAMVFSYEFRSTYAFIVECYGFTQTETGQGLS